MRRLFFISAIAFVGCGKAKKCYQCTQTYTAIDPKYTVPKTSTLQVCELSKDEIKAYELQNTRTNNIYAKVTTCTR